MARKNKGTYVPNDFIPYFQSMIDKGKSYHVAVLMMAIFSYDKDHVKPSFEDEELQLSWNYIIQPKLDENLKERKNLSEVRRNAVMKRYAKEKGLSENSSIVLGVATEANIANEANEANEANVANVAKEANVANVANADFANGKEDAVQEENDEEVTKVTNDTNDTNVAFEYKSTENDTKCTSVTNDTNVTFEYKSTENDTKPTNVTNVACVTNVEKPDESVTNVTDNSSGGEEAGSPENEAENYHQQENTENNLSTKLESTEEDNNIYKDSISKHSVNKESTDNLQHPSLDISVHEQNSVNLQNKEINHVLDNQVVVDNNTSTTTKLSPPAEKTVPKNETEISTAKNEGLSKSKNLDAVTSRWVNSMSSRDITGEVWKKLADVWNNLDSLRKAKELTELRRQKLLKLLDKYTEAEVLEGAAMVGKSDFLLGKKNMTTTKDGKQVRGWAATVDWFFDHFQDVYEGKYTDTEEAKGQFHNWMSEWVNSGVVCKGE